MTPRFLRIWLTLLALVFTVGCYRIDANGGDTEILVQAQFEKKLLGPSGFTGTAWRPMRHCVADLVDDSSNQIIESIALDRNGQGVFKVNSGRRVSVAINAWVWIPGTKVEYYMVGSVKDMSPNGPNKGVGFKDQSTGYNNVETFNKLTDVYWRSGSQVVNSGTTFAISVPSSKPEAAAFNLADQMVTFGETLDKLDPQAPMPDMHAFWGNASYSTESPWLALTADNKPLKQKNGPAILQFRVRSSLSGLPAVAEDGYNDGLIQQMLCRGLFADTSYARDGMREDSLIRRDNDDAYLPRNIAGDPALAFTNGFSDFLAGAIGGSNVLIDVDDNGTLYPFYLDRHNQFTMAPWQGEFYSGAVAVSLYGIWKQSLGGDLNALYKVYDPTVFAKDANQYTNTLLASYPTYLNGFKAQAGVNWSSVLGQLSQENITDVTLPSYFGSGTLWTEVGSIPALVQGSVTLTGANYLYDRDHQRCFRFTHSGPAQRRITLTFGGGTDLILELQDSKGLYAGSWNMSGSGSRVVDIPNLPSGQYLVRVRAGYYNTTQGQGNFTLSIQ